MIHETTFQKLTPKQQKAIPLLASGMSGKNVAKTINCNPATVSLWINHDQQFQKALGAFSKSSLHLAQVQLESLALSAINELGILLADAKSEQVRLRAIELIFSTLGFGDTAVKIGKAGQRASEDLALTDAGKYSFDKLIEAMIGE